MTIIATNKKAYHNYFLTEKWECGIALNGGEVKSLREGGGSFTDAFAHIDKGELYLYNLYINPYEQASYLNEEPARPRKLLVHAKELYAVLGTLQQRQHRPQFRIFHRFQQGSGSARERGCAFHQGLGGLAKGERTVL